jgi:peptidoglycan/xylan/chitin deacetylase (PgdA/CDA1 family)
MKPAKSGPFPYSTINRRPPLVWPNGAHVALWVIPNYEVTALDERYPPAGGMDPPDVMTWSSRDYGNRVAYVRMQEVMDRHGVRGTVALNSELCAQHPEMIEDGNERGWEWMGHGQTNTRTMRTTALDRERDIIHDALATIERETGTRPLGWLGPGLAESWNTLDYLIDERVEYVADWVNDDQPYLMQLDGGRRIVAMPYSTQLNDKVYETFHYTSAEFRGMIERQFDVLYREGATSGRVMGIALHPYLSGVPHRIADFDAALAYISKHEHVWKATGAEIARHYLSTVRENITR